MKSATIDAQLARPLERALDWALGLADSQGRLICPEHGVEHTGKSACVAILALELGRALGRQDYLDAAVAQGRRLVARLEREGDSPCFTFRPGRHDPFNCSNSVIDGGACSDALGSLVLELGDSLGADDRAAFARACVLHARTYLRYAAVDKGVPAQRAWALTGLARAIEVERRYPELLEGESQAPGDGVLVEAGRRAVEILAAIQHADGSYPYHPLEWGAGHPGASDVSSFYQSRVTGFLLFALPGLGLEPKAAQQREGLEAGLDFLAGLQGPDGVKCGLVEAKPWYWGATYEVASHPFDVFTLARGGALFGRDDWLRAARRAHRVWGDHLTGDGQPTSHRPGPGRGRSYQCPLFWAGHACWAARALPELSAASDTDEGQVQPSVRWFAEAQVARLEDACVVAWVRGARPRPNVHHGSPLGAGLLRVVERGSGRELLPRCRLGGHNLAEWSGLAGHLAPARGWRAGGEELRFSLWLARVEARAGRLGSALRTPLAVARRGILAFAHPRVSSAFDAEPEVDLIDHGLVVRSRLAHRDGEHVVGSALERTFRVDGQGLAVRDALASAGAARRVTFLHPGARTPIGGPVIGYRIGPSSSSPSPGGPAGGIG
ncbi:hypothetical protein Pla86_24610 [Planctomycetes bacterium Pla86]|uniref:Uncharacterized protein n=1 Tax=Engelhardtia mirabilis TaxID=2528011 RepID=A0A518BK75_9BACT|nr:hypothetical protein Pla133_24620 [Planctomycetes bacterium Pla133]QDV01706.1 hypothetical protein Pla86_24610 [Planctomycetes bacterium Pla86]